MQVTPIDIWPYERLNFPLFLSQVSCGFPSPADDYLESPVQLSELLVKNPNATFFVRASGNSMRDRGINDGAILTIDRSVQPQQDQVVLAAINGEFTCKIWDKQNGQLLAANPDYPPIELSPESHDLIIQGVVTFAINPVS